MATIPSILSDLPFIDLLAKLEEIKAVYADKTLGWYSKRVPIVRSLFRATGFLVILLSATATVLVNEDEQWTKPVLSVCTVLITALTALAAFFQWQASWQKYIKIQLTIEYLIAIWQLDICKARQQGDNREGRRIAVNATQKLIDAVGNIVEAEAKYYFGNLNMPGGPITGTNQ